MFSRLLFRLVLFVTRNLKFVTRNPKIILLAVLALFIAPFMGLITAKFYQSWDDDPDRGAIAIEDGAFGESYSTPEYLDQGWDEADSLWFYNTTQGSALLPYDFFLVLEQADVEDKKKIECDRNGEKAAWFLCPRNVDRFRYLPQNATFFNPDALPVGFVKETYKSKDYVGFTCAACHTAQINYNRKAIRIDGGPAMANIVKFLKALQKSMVDARKGAKNQRFIEAVLKLDNNYNSKEEIAADLKKWTDVIKLYNTVNNSTFKGRKVEYGYARLDAFGRIYNRVLQHVINKNQFAGLLSELVSGAGNSLLTPKQVENVLEDVDETVIRDADFTLILERLVKEKPDYPKLSKTDLLRVRNKIFNPPNAPVSYPFLWDIAQSDYVQWNGLANNAPPGPLGRNAGEVIGVFAILDWKEDDSWFGLYAWLQKFRLSTWVSGQGTKEKVIDFESSVDRFNLQRLESHLRNLQSPKWPFCKDGEGNYYLPKVNKDAAPNEDKRPCADGKEKFDEKMTARGKKLYDKHCQSCHEVIDRDDWDRKVIAKMLKIDKAGTDKAMAKNSVNYKGKSGNFEHTYQPVSVGKIVVDEDAPVVQLLTAATAGTLVTPDPDKWWPRRWVEGAYTIFMSLADNDIKKSIKRGKYKPDTTAEPYASLLSYKARSLNGIWATAPYLHNGSVPSLYDLLLPVKREGYVDGDPCEKYRPEAFTVGEREFDPKKVGFVYKVLEKDEFLSEEDGRFKFNTDIRGNFNTGHDYGACKRTEEERLDLIEYLKSL